MNNELNKQLAALAAKLGVSVEHLWGVLVRQAYIDGLSSLVTVFCCAAAGVGVLWFFFYRRRKYKLSAETDSSAAKSKADRPCGIRAPVVVLLGDR